ncbi:MAG: 4Fe-4S dicluster domain-containing protein [Deltaproteobacteria bacterium]|nr:4Fe-4S dicluster domain-containing protein [Deltaproteobacteria bacterium]
MFYNVSLYASLLIFLIGILYKVSTWFWRDIGVYGDKYGALKRIKAAACGMFRVLLSRKILTLIRVFVLDGIVQRRVLRENFLRWLMHVLIFAGFMLLLLFHALDNFVSERLFPEYMPTLNPAMFLRDLFGMLALIGIGIAVYRRLTMRVPRLKTNPMDFYAVAILAVIMLSGVFLEGVKITSYGRYLEMVEEYSDTDEEEELRALEALWVKEYGVVSPKVKSPFEEDIIEQGREINELSCSACHSKPSSAFAGYAIAQFVKPVALGLDRVDMRLILWYIHFLSCFIGLAYLPFSKMFHIFSSPISLMANAVMDRDRSDPANMATRQVMELDACTHCGTCSRHCSVAAAFYSTGNIKVLPSEKMVYLKRYVAGKDLKDRELRSIQEGAYLCTNCDRCTVVCPVGINLRELWYGVKEEMIQRDLPTPLVLSQFSFYRGVERKTLEIADYERPLNRARGQILSKCELMKDSGKVIDLNRRDRGLRERAIRSLQGNTFAYCYACENCTSVCPVVENYENPQEKLGLLPHQIMRSLGMGLKDLALGSGMLWDCVTCYQCQEHCPQGVKVTDILYELKNMAVRESFSGNGP